MIFLSYFGTIDEKSGFRFEAFLASFMNKIRFEFEGMADWLLSLPCGGGSIHPRHTKAPIIGAFCGTTTGLKW
jgi:hypothetical protein